MTREEFEAKYPLILEWIQRLISQSASQATPVGSLGFKRLPYYFRPETLALAKVVYVPKVPAPPLRALGLSQFTEFEEMNAAGTTYLDTFFSLDQMRSNESHHFHELIHVIQWQVLGPKGFLATYADGLERFGYRRSPLEVMAYELEAAFQGHSPPFDALNAVQERLRE